MTKINRSNRSLLLENRLDALEAFEVFSHFRNFLFWIILVMLGVSQLLFWMVDRGIVDHRGGTTTNESIDISAPACRPGDGVSLVQVAYSVRTESQSTDNPPQAVVPETPDLEQTRVIKAQPPRPGQGAIERSLRLVNYFGAIACLIYCFCLAAGMALVIIGNLGGLSSAAKAFFLSLGLLVLVLPWQRIILPELPGTLYNLGELARLKTQVRAENDLFGWILYYGRFSGLWLLSMLLLILSQLRSMGSVKAVRQQVRQTLSSLTETGVIQPPAPTATTTSLPIESTDSDDKPIPLE